MAGKKAKASRIKQANKATNCTLPLFFSKTALISQ
jgi:hypothetical protein